MQLSRHDDIKVALARPSFYRFMDVYKRRAGVLAGDGSGEAVAETGPFCSCHCTIGHESNVCSSCSSSVFVLKNIRRVVLA